MTVHHRLNHTTLLIKIKQFYQQQYAIISLNSWDKILFFPDLKLDDKTLLGVARNLTLAEVCDLADKQLGIGEAQISHIKEDHINYPDHLSKNFRILRTWTEQKPEDACPAVLFDYLVQMDLKADRLLTVSGEMENLGMFTIICTVKI